MPRGGQGAQWWLVRRTRRLTSSTTRMRLQTKTRVTRLVRVRVRVRPVQTKTRVTRLYIVSRQ